MKKRLPPCPRLETLRELWPDERDTLPPGHPGLVFDRYLPIWEPGRFAEREPNPSHEALGAFARAFARAGERRDGQLLLQSVQARLERMVDSLDAQTTTATRTFDLEARTRIAIGLGMDHPSEAGLLFDHTIGVPYLPATGLRGLGRYYAELSEASPEGLRRLFGSTDRKSSEDVKQLGSLRFFDAYPLSWPALEVDILTPHYGSYYTGDRPDAPPGDWHAPVPIPFLTISAATRFRLRLATTGPSSDLDTVQQWLAQALDMLGIGAKTAVGYGRIDVKR